MAQSLDPNESVAILESQGMMVAARLVQLIGQETRARIVAVSPAARSGSITTIIAGPLAVVQHALELARERDPSMESAFFARPNLETMEMLIGSAVGEPIRVPKVKNGKRDDRSLPLFGEQGASQALTGAKRLDKKAKKLSSTTPVHGSQSNSSLINESPVRDAHLTRNRRRTAEPFLRLSLMEIERMTVHTLRRYARSIPEFPIVGREISRSNRGDLLQLIKSHFEHLDTRQARSVSVQTMMPS